MDVEDPIPDDVLDQIVLPTLDGLGAEVADAIVNGDGRWREEYAWVGEELDELSESITNRRDDHSLTGRETLLWIQTFLQRHEMGPEQGGRGWNDNGFLTSDRIEHIRNRINTVIKDLGYDVIKSHEAGIREMSRTDYMFLDPDMVEFVDVATTHSLGGFGNASHGLTAETVRRRVKARKEAA